MTKLRLIFKGGKGSGNFGHSGRVGKIGGSGKANMSKESAEGIISSLSNRFGMPRVGVETTDDYNISANARGSNIKMNVEVLNSDVVFDPRYNDSVAQNPTEVIIHEYGHVIQRELLLDPQYIDYGLSKPSNYHGSNKTWQGSLGSKIDRIAFEEGEKISQYATKNGEEYFAEAFTLYNKGQKHWKNINPEVLEIFRRLDKTK